MTDISELPNYKLVWNQLIEVDEKFKPLFDQMAEKGNLINIKAGFDFAENGLRMIHRGEADVMLLSQSRYDDTLPFILRTEENVGFDLVPADKMRGHDVKIAFSKRSSLDSEERRHISKAVADFKAGVANQAATAGEKTPMQLMMEAVDKGEELPAEAKARLSALPVEMLDQVGEMQNLTPEQVEKLKKIHATLQ